MIPKDTVDAIMQATVIEEVVGEFVQLKKSGTSMRGLSPFTNEKTPSFYVVPGKGIFKDFSSGKGGSAVTFLMEHEKLSYCLLYTSPSPRDLSTSRMPSSA